MENRFKMISIFLADDHQIVRKGIKALLSMESDFKIIGEAGDGIETVKLVEELQPDILILDLMMGGINGLEVTRQLVKKKPKMGIVVLSMHSNEAYVLEALRSGAMAYILKDNTTEDLVHAIREVAAGRRYLSAPLSDRAITAYTQKTDTSFSQDPYEKLTTREREVLEMSAQGFSSADIASRLLISPRTVETHRANLMHKLGIRTQAELLQYAVLRGIIPGQS
jgi:two-component system, NarL family, response regulator NreC